MRFSLYIIAFLSVSFQGFSQSFIGASGVTPAFAAAVTGKCKPEAKRWTIADGKITRHYDNGFDYTLIDTAGLFVYVKARADGKNTPAANAPLEGYFSIDGCGEIYKLNFYSLKKYFRDQTDFIKALKKEQDADLFRTTGKTTRVNALYKEHMHFMAD